MEVERTDQEGVVPFQARWLRRLVHHEHSTGYRALRLEVVLQQFLDGEWVDVPTVDEEVA